MVQYLQLVHVIDVIAMKVEHFELRGIREPIVKMLQIVVGQIYPLEVLILIHYIIHYGRECFDRSDFIVADNQSGANEINLDCFLQFLILFFFVLS